MQNIAVLEGGRRNCGIGFALLRQTTDNGGYAGTTELWIYGGYARQQDN